MGKRYDKYVEKVQATNQAKVDLAAAYGGSTHDGMLKAQDNLYWAERAEDQAWDSVLEDPEN